MVAKLDKSVAMKLLKINSIHHGVVLLHPAIVERIESVTRDASFFDKPRVNSLVFYRNGQKTKHLDTPYQCTDTVDELEQRFQECT
jgi:hypothetical protein